MKRCYDVEMVREEQCGGGYDRGWHTGSCCVVRSAAQVVLKMQVCLVLASICSALINDLNTSFMACGTSQPGPLDPA
jgi:hypothetical protein